jgi:nitrite reductase/ring-hydroxylating ferredoxin subunit/uncharacterized membrane protein
VPPTAPSPLDPLARRLESLGFLDAPAKTIGKAVRGAIKAGAVKDLISGTPLGHSLHPVLTDVTIGTFLSATILDVLGGDDEGSASEMLLAVGIASYGPTAVAGFTDWADSEVADPRVRRLGLVHGLTNASALALFTASLLARRSGDSGKGKALGLAGTAVLSGGGYLGGHLSFVRGVGPNRTAYNEGPSDWAAAVDPEALTPIDAGQLEPDKPRSALVGDTPVMLLRHREHLHGLHDWCSHRGCSLAGGKIDEHIVTCPCHGSQFDIQDGSVQRGPATTAQPVFDVRERDGSIEVRLRDQ